MELKRLSKAAIPAALEKAERYRLLNEPEQCESICDDVLAADPENEEATVMLILALSDQFSEHSHDRGRALERARALAGTLPSPYDRSYYCGLVAERRARALLSRGGAGSRVHAAGWLRDAMEHFVEAEKVRPDGDDSSILRWNACARLLARHPDLAGTEDEPAEPLMSE